jgi:hypothetical protein
MRPPPQDDYLKRPHELRDAGLARGRAQIATMRVYSIVKQQIVAYMSGAERLRKFNEAWQGA